MQRSDRVRGFVDEIWKWFAQNKRTLPWRDLSIVNPDHRAYCILVSEIMLQQTQVPRVIGAYRRFLDRFPTMCDLAAASNRDILLVWRGMGYNSRALRLRDAVRTIVVLRQAQDDNALFPTSMEELTELPGVGHYTAAAIRNFAFDIPTPCLDTNIRRILHRVFVGPEGVDGSWEKDDEYLLKIAEEVLEIALNKKQSAAHWHAALMDFGSLVQTKRNPRWDLCPLTRKGIMKTTKKSYELRVTGSRKLATRNPKPVTVRREPGRLVGSTFVPNRIFRGRVIDALRDAPEGLTLKDIGKRITIDWNAAEHREWLEMILKKLTREMMLGVKRGRYVLG